MTEKNRTASYFNFFLIATGSKNYKGNHSFRNEASDWLHEYAID